MLRNPFTRSETKILALLAAVQFAHIVDFMLFMPLGPQLMRLFSMSPDQFSLVVGSYTFCAGITGLVSAFILDHFDRKRSLLICFFAFGLGTFGCTFANKYEELLLARAFTGAFGGILASQVFAIVGDAIAPERRGSATGIIMGAFSLASIFGVPLSLYLADLGSWHTPLIALAGFTLVVAIFLLRWLPTQSEHLQSMGRNKPWQFLRTVPYLRRPRLAILLMVSMVLGQFSVIPFLSPSLVANAGMQESQLPLIYLIGGLVSMLSSPFFGLWSDRYGPMQVLFWSGSFSALAILGITHLPAGPLWIPLLASSLFFIAMGGRMVPTMMLVTGSVLPKNRGTYMSLTASLQQFAASGGAWIAGYLVHRGTGNTLVGYTTVGYFSVLLTVVALAVAYQLRHEPKQVKY